MAKDLPLKGRRTQRGRPGTHQSSITLCTAEKARVCLMGRVFTSPLYSWAGLGAKG